MRNETTRGGDNTFVVVVYDVGVERIGRVRNLLSKYLLWVQNSVFEGELTKYQLGELKDALKLAIDPSHDRVRIYVRLKGTMEIRTLGYDKATYSVI